MQFRSMMVAAAAVIALSGCDQLGLVSQKEAEPSATTVTEPEPAPPVDVVAETLARGAAVFTGGKQNLRFPPELTVTAIQPDNHVVVSGTLIDPIPAGQTGGLVFPVPEEIERAASGKLIRIHAVVSSEAAGEAFLAYSTNEVGNSGWMPFQVTTEEAAVVLEYSVPVMNEGRDDFIGIDPKGNTLTIKAIAVEVVS